MYPYIDTGYKSFTARGNHKRIEHAYGRHLTGAVGTEQPEDFPDVLLDLGSLPPEYYPGTV